MLYSFDEKTPIVDDETYVSETAIVIGDVKIGKNCYIGHGAIIRGDYGRIEIGNETSIEEGVVIHAPPNEVCFIGNGVIIGHGAIIHAKKINDNVVIGMGAILSFWSEIGEGSIVAEGSIVTKNQNIESNVVAAGHPAKKIREVSEKEKEFWEEARKRYVKLAQKCKEGCIKRIPSPIFKLV